jgi:hypothetical protein
MQSDDMQLVQRIFTTQGYAKKIEQFRDYLGGDKQEQQLCDDYLDLVLKQYGPQAGEECLGFQVIRKFATTGADGGPEYLKWLKSHIDKAFGSSLLMVHALSKFTDRQISPSETLRRYIAEELIKRVSSNAEYLGGVLDPDYPHTLYHLLRFREKFPCYNTPEEWHQIFSSILASAEKTPSALIPDLAHLLIKDVRQEIAPSLEDSGFRFDNSYAVPLIPDSANRKRLVKLFLEYAASNDANLQIRKRIRGVVGDLRQFAEM